MTKHDYYHRDDGLSHCRVCNGGEASLTLQCCGRRLTDQEETAVMAGTLQFNDGKWWSPVAAAPTATPVAAATQKPAGWTNSAMLKSAAVSQDRGGPFDTHVWSEGPTAVHDTPIYTATAQPVAPAGGEPTGWLCRSHAQVRDGQKAFPGESLDYLWTYTHGIRDLAQVEQCGDFEVVRLYAPPPQAVTAGGEPFGHVAVYRIDAPNHVPRYEFYLWPQPPYMDNASECYTVFRAAPPQVLQPLTDEQCDAIAAEAMAEVAKVRGMHALDLNPNIQEHYTLRRALIRAGAKAWGVKLAGITGAEG